MRGERIAIGALLMSNNPIFLIVIVGLAWVPLRSQASEGVYLVDEPFVSDSIVERAEPNKNRESASALDGIYSGLAVQLRLSPSGSLDRDVTTIYVTFYPNGKVYRRVPEGGLENWDILAAEEENPDLWGSYTQTGSGHWKISWNSGQASEVFREGDDLRYEGGLVSPVSSCEGLKLHGIYVQPGYQDIDEPYFVAFNDEGLFLDSGLIGLVAYQDLSQYDSRTVAPGTGHYRIGRNTLYLDYQDGSNIRVALHAQTTDAETRPIPVIYINATRLLLFPE